MTTKLQQVIARSKVATLDDKLRGVAERVLKDKFDVKTPNKDTNSKRGLGHEALQAVKRYANH